MFYFSVLVLSNYHLILFFLWLVGSKNPAKSFTGSKFNILYPNLEHFNDFCPSMYINIRKSRFIKNIFNAFFKILTLRFLFLKNYYY